MICPSSSDNDPSWVGTGPGCVGKEVLQFWFQVRLGSLRFAKFYIKQRIYSLTLGLDAVHEVVVIVVIFAF